MFLCQLSGSVPAEPVVTPDGIVYDKNLIIQHLNQNPTDPSNGKSLKPSDLIDIKCAPVNKPTGAVTQGDIQVLTKSLTEKYDALLLELQQVRKERDEARHQVTHLMYLRDGATRVVGKQLQEIDFLKSQLSALKAESGERPHKQARTSVTDEAALNSLITDISNLAAKLMQSRKQRRIVARTHDMFKDYQHAEAAFRAPGALCLRNVISAYVDNKARRMPGIMALGFNDGTIKVHNFASETPLQVVSGHQKAVRAIQSIFYPSVADLSEITLGTLGSSSDSPAPFESCLNILSGSDDGTLRHWRDTKLTAIENISWLTEENKFAGKAMHGEAPKSLALACQNVYRLDLDEITSINVHPYGTLTAVTGKVNKWSLIDLVRASTVRQFNISGEPDAQCRGLAFQPDGNLALGIATNKKLPVWDIRTTSLESMPKCPSITGDLSAISFSEIGYIVATVTTCGKLQIWDMRKALVTQTFDVEGSINSCMFDYSGRHVVLSTDQGTKVYSAVEKKRYEMVVSWDSNTPSLTSFFDHRTDDYIARLRQDGAVDVYHAY